jgi:hypothetical protein
MKFNLICQWGMFNWAITPAVSVWRNKDGGGGFATHFLRGRLGFWIALNTKAFDE